MKKINLILICVLALVEVKVKGSGEVKGSGDANAIFYLLHDTICIKE
jgi:hypothetical protein